MGATRPTSSYPRVDANHQDTQFVGKKWAISGSARRRPARGGLIVGVVIGIALLGCKKTDTKLPDDPRTRRSTDITLEQCQLDSESTVVADPNRDGKAEVVQVMDGKREVCRAVDLNFDGTYDRITFFDDAGKIRRVESDYDRDGRIDEIALYRAGQIVEKHRATTMDGKLDTWDFYQNGRVTSSERDEDGDGIIDQWWEYPKQGCPLIHVDADGDGRPDPGASIDYCKETGYVPPELASEIRDESGYGQSTEEVKEVSNVPEGSDDAGQEPRGPDSQAAPPAGSGNDTTSADDGGDQ